MTEAEQISTVKLFRLHIDNGDLPGASRYLDPPFSIDEPDSQTPQTTQGFVATLERIMDWSCPGLTDTTCKGRGTLEASVNHVITEAEEAGFAGEERGAAEAATS